MARSRHYSHLNVEISERIDVQSVTGHEKCCRGVLFDDCGSIDAIAGAQVRTPKSWYLAKLLEFREIDFAITGVGFGSWGRIAINNVLKERFVGESDYRCA